MKPLDSNQNLVLSTKTNLIFSGVAANSITGFNQPPTGGAYMKVTVSGGTDNTGTVTIDGEVFTFTTADWQIGTVNHTTLTTLTSANLASETTKPTIKIEAVDMAGSPITTKSSTSYPCQFVPRKPSANARALLHAQGITAPSFYRVRLEYDLQEVGIGQEFTIDGQLQTYIIWEEPIRHFQLGTDLVDYIEFTATIKV